ncbi:hypothetical protein, secreted [gut metagenome]|uniref:Lipocalin-like domain-containing protein n=1 Tax=gut metagenome TaxID=749906 RepID=J9H3S8_9ZZZZ
MKTLFKMMALFLVLFCFAACDDDEEIQTALEVTPANLDGTWKLTEWNGNSLPENSYCYITFSRKDKTYKMYQNFNSMYAKLITGKFNITKDEDYGYIIKGKYDYGNGSWNYSYIVTDLLPTGSMVWTAKENPADVQRYEKCPSVPSHILDEIEK